MKKIITVVLASLLFLIYLLIPLLNFKILMLSEQSEKFVAFVTILASIIALYGIKIFFVDKLLLVLTYLDLSLIALLCYLILNKFYSPLGLNFSFRLYELLGLGVLYVVLRNSKETIFWGISVCIILSGFLQAIHGNLQLYGLLESNHELFKITGSFFNPGPYAGYLATVFPICAYAYVNKAAIMDRLITLSSMNERNKSLMIRVLRLSLQRIAPLTGLVIILALAPTQSRAAWLSVLISSLGVLYSRFLFRDSHIALTITKNYRRLLLAIVSIGIITSAYFMYDFKRDSSDGRLLIWEVTSKLISNNVLTGVGFDNFKGSYMAAQKDHFLDTKDENASYLADNVYYAYNEFLQYWAENGFIGLTILFICITLLLTRIKDMKLPLSAIGVIGLISILVFSLMSYPLEILPIKINALFFLATLANRPSSNSFNIDFTLGKIYNFIFRIFVSVLLLTAAGYSYIMTERLVGSLKQWRSGFYYYQSGEYFTSLIYYQEAYPELSKNGMFLIQYGKALGLSDEYSRSIRILREAAKISNNSIVQTSLGDSYKATGLNSLAEEAYLSAIYMTPGKLYPRYLLAKYYEDTRQRQKAKVVADYILTMRVKVNSKASNDIIKEMRELSKL